ncbi:MAG: cation:proton antiporter [Armatimonadota bacterium]
MQGSALVGNMLIVLTTSLLVVYLLGRLRLPTVLGFLLTGILIGPGGLRLIENRGSVQLLADVGVVLLVFTTALSFSLKALARLRWTVIGGIVAQVVITVLLAPLLGSLSGLPWTQGIFWGFLLISSSTALVVRVLEDNNEMTTPAGQFSLSITIFQDLAVVALILIVPMLGASGDLSSWAVPLALGRSVALVALILLISAFAVPRILKHVARTRSAEMFTLTVLVLGVGTAWISGWMGLSLALGAYLAGIVISETRYSENAIGQIMPLRDVSSGIFFVSLGMLVEPRLWLQWPLELVGLTVGLILFKFLVMAIIVFFLGLGARTLLISALALAQIGEFSFILAQEGLPQGLLSATTYQVFLSASVLSMAVNPLLIKLVPPLLKRAYAIDRVRERLLKLLPWLSRRAPFAQTAPSAPSRREHVVIVGYGLNGRTIARALALYGTQLCIIELNAETVRVQAERGLDIIYGDACREEIQRRAGVSEARVLVVTVADTTATRCIIAVSDLLNPTLHTVVRTRLVSEVPELLQLGANDVVPEELATSLELVERIMAAYGATEQEIEAQQALIRAEDYALLRE